MILMMTIICLSTGADRVGVQTRADFTVVGTKLMMMMMMVIIIMMMMMIDFFEIASKERFFHITNK